MSHILHLSLSRSGYKMSHLLHRSLMGIQIWCLLQQELIHHVDTLWTDQIQPMSWVETPPDQNVLLWLSLFREQRTKNIRVDTLRLTETYQFRVFWFSSPAGYTKARENTYQDRYLPVNGNLPCGQ